MSTQSSQVAERRRIIIAIVLLLSVGTVANSCDEKGLGDAPVGNAYEAERDVIVMPDRFPNLVVVCDGPTRIYVTTREAPPVVVADSPNCPADSARLEEQGDSVEYDPEG